MPAEWRAVGGAIPRLDEVPGLAAGCGMSLELSDLRTMIARRAGQLWICNIPHRLLTFLGCSTGAVYLSWQSALHIREKHREITEFDMLHLPLAVSKGEIRREAGKLRLLAFYTIEDKEYVVPLKIAKGGHEIWISSMYRITPKQSLKKRANTLGL
jgi:hypothetical protein